MAGQTNAPPANYSSLVFALEWQPQWSLAACPGAQYQELTLVQKMSEPGGAWARANLSVHGLWPNYDYPSKHAGYSWPQFCDVPGFDYPACQHGSAASCGPTAGGLAAFNTSGRWQRFALQYAWSTLATHEWSKHGSCTPPALGSGAYDVEYWQWQEDVLDVVSAGTGFALVSGSVGGSVSYAALHDAFTSDLGGASPALVCVSGCMLEQVHGSSMLRSSRKEQRSA
jgi:ribonuclease I